MSEFYYENQGNSTYFVYQVADDRELDTLTLGMLTNNSIANFAPVVFTRQDAFMYVKYNVTAKVSVQQLWGDVVSKKHLIGVLKGIIGAVLNAEEYMIDIDSLVFDADKIFVDVSTGNVEMICLPVIGKKQKAPDFKRLFREILFSARLNPNENNDYFVRLINFLNEKSAFLIEECREILERASSLTGETSADQSRVQKAVRTPVNNRSEQNSIPQNSIPQINENRGQYVPNMPENVKPQPMMPEKKPVSQAYAPPGGNGQGISGAQGMAVPPMRQPVQPQQTVQQPMEKQQEKEMSWFYLMQHYNSENAALYKEQKAKKKQQEKENTKGKDKGKDKDKGKGKDKKNAASAQSSVSFSIPGQPVKSVGQPQVVAQSAAPSNAPVQNAANQASVQQKPVSNMYAKTNTNSFVQGKANFGETTVLNGGGMGETTVLSAYHMQENPQVRPYLLRVKNNEKILLNKPVFRIGKEKSYVDYFVGDNTAISRSHANIISRDNGYFIMDTNSTNHTYVNGTMIQSNEEIRLMEGTKIRLANEDFEFHLDM